MSEWHRLTTTAAAAALQADPAAGLSSADAARRRAEHGPNELTEQAGRGPWAMLLTQFADTMVVILILAAVLSAFLGKWLEAGAIIAVVLLFGVLGFIQEFRAEQAIAALRRMAVPTVRVTRDGTLQEVPAVDLVPGDVVLLEAGNVIPADLRLVEAVNLRCQEAALTGESEPVDKTTDPLDREDLPLGDRRNLAFMGTQATYGRGRGLVVATGMNTELGHVAALLQGTHEELTPLQVRLVALGRLLALGGIVVAGLIMGIGVLRRESVQDMFLTAISVAVAVVPEGLPAVVTVTLALGAQRMLKRKALIRRLPAVETLGSVTVICSDKTGTLTENRMTVTVLDVAGHRIDLLEDLRGGKPAAMGHGDAADLLAAQPDTMTVLVAGGALCNDAVLRSDPETGRYHALGDPTEGALLVAAERLGLQRDAILAALPRVAEVPFDSDRKRMTTVHRVVDPSGLPRGLAEIVADAAAIELTKGAVDSLLDVTTAVWDGDRYAPAADGWADRVRAAAEGLAANGMRVLGVAFRRLDAAPDAVGEEDEHDLVFVGLVGMVDPPRTEVKDAIATCRAAGIRPVMITGDHPLTAAYIARQLGLSTDDRVLTGADLAKLSDEQLREQVATVSVYARVNPEHKLRIVTALQSRGEVCAMTGDGVNDAPALKRADIGVAMGITGTDVAKEASEMVLLDDNFATIVAAVEEGRVIYDNVKRFVRFSVAGNLGKVLVMLLSPFFGLNVALLPLQLLWLNLVTDGLLGLGMGVEPSERDTMRRPPSSIKGGVFDQGTGWSVIAVGLLIGAVALSVGVWGELVEHHGAQTMMFTILTFLQVGQALANRSVTLSVFQKGLLSNRLLLGLIIGAVLLQLAAIYAPPLQVFLKTEPLTALELAVCFGLGSLCFVALELEKVVRRARARRRLN